MYCWCRWSEQTEDYGYLKFKRVNGGKMFGITPFIFLLSICQFGVTIQACQECKCCSNGQNYCTTDKICIRGCQAGYYGGKCTEKCLDNCKTCVNGQECTECKPGYYTNKCHLPCGKGCLNNTCSMHSGECLCSSSNFVKGKCDACIDGKYGNECNNTCPSNCGLCISDTYCSWCKNDAYYGPYCQYSCPPGCKDSKCTQSNGYCIRGCKPMYTGDKCDTCSSALNGTFCALNCSENCSFCTSESDCVQCKSGFYGETCKHVCPSGCNGSCSITDGRCFVCKPGLTGDFCNITCNEGKYGVNCTQYCHNIEQYCQACSMNELGNYRDCTKCVSGYYPVICFGDNHTRCIQCPNTCKERICNTSGACINGCERNKWGDKCNNDCAVNCVECNQNDGTCFECTRDSFLQNCSQMCNNNCNNTDNDRICAMDTGRCLHGCNSTIKYGYYCEKQCSATCKNHSCDWKTGHCSAGCAMDYYGSFCNQTCAQTCQSNISKRKCDDEQGHCLYGCKDGFHGLSCDKKCSNACFNASCYRLTAECLYGCIYGYEGSKCLQAIKKSEENKLLVTIATSAGAGFAVVILLIVLVICLIKRKRRQSLSSTRKCEENEYVQDMQEIPKQNNTDDSAVIYAQPYKPKQQAGGDTGKLYGTAKDDDENISAIDNDYSVIKSAKAKNNCFEANDTLHANKSNKPSIGNSDYAVVNKVKSAVKKTECIEELYDTTHDNKRNKHNLNSNNEYAVLGVRSDNAVGVGNTKEALATEGHDLYHTAEGSKFQSMLQPSNDYAVFKDNNSDNHEAVKANTLFDTESREKTMQPINNDYEFGSEDGE